MDNVVIYARFSSDKQTEQSIEGQLRYCYQYAEQHDYRVVGEYIDRAISGTSDRRPQFQQMIADAGSKQFKYILVWKLDRFARNRYDSAIYKAKLKKFGVKVLSVTEGIGDGDESIILEAVLEAMAETYSRQLSQNVRRGMHESALKCLSTGGTTPYGYKLIDGKLTIDERAARDVKYIFEQYAAGARKSEIVAELNARGSRTQTGSPFVVNSLRNILKNKKYIGIYHYNNDIEIEGGCPAIIDKALFDRCAARAAQNRRAPGKGKGDDEYLLTGKVFCGHCGSPMIGDSGKGKSGIIYHYYVCSKRKRHGGAAACPKKREDKGFLEWYVVEQAVKYALDPERIALIAERVVAAYNRDFSADTVADLERQISAAQREMDKLADSLINAGSPRLVESINKKAAQLDAQISELEDELSKLRICAAARLTEDQVKAWLRSFCSGDPLDPAFRRRIIDVLVNAVYLCDDKIIIFYNIKDGKQLSYIDFLQDFPDAPPEDECSDLMSSGSPETPYASAYGAFDLFIQFIRKFGGLDGQLSPRGAEAAAYRIPRRADIRPSAAIERHFAPIQRLERKAGSYGAADPSPPVFGQHIDPDLPHCLTIGGATGKADKPVAVIGADGKHITLTSRGIERIAPLGQIERGEILRGQHPQLKPAVDLTQQLNIREPILRHKAHTHSVLLKLVV